MRHYLIFLLLPVLLLAACGGDDDSQSLPTRANLEQNEATADPEPTAIPVTPTRASRAATLPPTYTPTPTASPTQPAPTDTPEPASAAGHLYYIANGNAIVRINPDGTERTQIASIGGGAIAELRPSPQHDLLAFIAPGSGSAREVWVVNRDGTYTQQISCLGHANVRHLAWHPDNEQVAFASAQAPGDPLDIYITSIVGSNDCPQANNQRQLMNVDSTRIGGMAFSPDGDTLFYSDTTIFAYDIASGETSDSLTRTVGAGPDFALSFRPGHPSLLTYLRDTVAQSNRPTAGDLLVLDVSDVSTPQIALEQRISTTSYDWSPDGNTLLMSSPNSVSTFEYEARIGQDVASETAFVPEAVYSPDGERAAFIDAEPEQADQPQVYTTQIGRRDRQQITNESVTISNLVWEPASPSNP